MAVFPLAPGTGDYASNSASAFTPTIWSTQWAIKHYGRTFLSEITNTDYSGQITAKGDKVMIRVVPDGQVDDYFEGMDISNAPYLSSTHIELSINKGKLYRFPVGKLQEKQMDVDFVAKQMDNGAKLTTQAQERDFLANIYSSAAATNIGATAGKQTAGYDMGSSGAPIGIDKTNAVEYLQDAFSVIEEADVVEDGFVVIPSWYANALGKSDIKNASLTALTSSPSITGKLPQKIAGLNVFVTNRYTTIADSGGQTAYPIIFGVKSSLTFATQMTDLEVRENPKALGKLIISLVVYGYQCVNADGLGVLYAYKA